MHKLRRLNVEQSFKFDRRESAEVDIFRDKKKKKKFDIVNLSRMTRCICDYTLIEKGVIGALSCVASLCIYRSQPLMIMRWNESSAYPRNYLRYPRDN